MRFVPATLALALITLSSGVRVEAQSAERITRAQQPSPVTTQSARKMPRGNSAAPQVMTGLYAVKISENLGTVSAVAQDEDGTIYTLDAQLGRLYALPDRAQDGTPDGRRLFMDGFERPSGLAYANDTLYIADANAVWAVDIESRNRRQITSLHNTGADPLPRPLAVMDGHIILGLSTTTRSNTAAHKASAHIVRIHPATGRANTIQRNSSGAVRALMAQSSGQVWAAIGTQLIPLSSSGMAFPVLSGAPIMGLAFGTRDTQPDNWPATLRGAMFLSLGKGIDGAEGSYSVVALSSEFGAPAKDVKIFANGFYNARTDQIWGQPTALMMTPHGLLIADRFGTLWRAAVDDRPAKIIKEKTASPPPVVPTQKPSQARGTTTPMAGSQLGRSASGIKTGTSITTGSTLIKKYEAEKAAKEKAETEAEAAKRVKNKTEE